MTIHISYSQRILMALADGPKTIHTIATPADAQFFLRELRAMQDAGLVRLHEGTGAYRLSALGLKYVDRDRETEAVPREIIAENETP